MENVPGRCCIILLKDNPFHPLVSILVSLSYKFNNHTSKMSNAEVLVLRGTLEGHNGWVTSLATSAGQPNLLLSASRDKTLISWKLTGDDQQYGVPVRSFKGHSHIVQDCALTADGAYALSASWDKTLRLWDVATGETYQRFVGHKSDVMSVAIDRKASMIISGSRDKTVKVWTIKGQCLATMLGHNDWVSQVRIVPTEDVNDDTVTVISAGMDKMVKVCLLLLILFCKMVQCLHFQ